MNLGVFAFGKKKRGMSEVVITLLLVMLAIVLVGIVFVVVNNLVKTGTQQASTQAACLSSQIGVISFSCTSTGSQCNVTVKRTIGSDTIGGVRVVFTNAKGESNITDRLGNIVTPSTKLIQANNTGISNITQVSAVIYFVSGRTVEPCPATSAGLVGTVTSTGTSGTSSGGTTGGTTPPGGTPPPGGTTSTCTPFPSADSTLTAICANVSMSCGMAYNGTGTGCPKVLCGNPSYPSDPNYGCVPPYYCNSTLVNNASHCVAPIVVNSGTVVSVYPNNTVLFFSGSNFPKNSSASVSQAYNSGNYYVRFPGSNDTNSQGQTNCTQIAYIQCLPSYPCSVNQGTSFVDLLPVFPISYVNISIGNDYQIWNRQQGCQNASGTLTL